MKHHVFSLYDLYVLAIGAHHHNLQAAVFHKDIYVIISTYVPQNWILFNSQVYKRR